MTTLSRAMARRDYDLAVLLLTLAAARVLARLPRAGLDDLLDVLEGRR